MPQQTSRVASIVHAPSSPRAIRCVLVLLAILAMPALASDEACEQIHPGSGIEPPVAVHTVVPEYSTLARRARIQGVVILATTVRRDGTVGTAEVLKGLPMGLSEKAVEAVRQRRFEPATRNGEPLCVRFNQTVNFQLQEQTMFGGAVAIPTITDGVQPIDSVTVVAEPDPPPGPSRVGFFGLTVLLIYLLTWFLGLLATIAALWLLIWLLNQVGFPRVIGRFGAAVARAYREAQAHHDRDLEP